MVTFIFASSFIQNNLAAKTRHYYSISSIMLAHFIFVLKLLVLAVIIIVKTVVFPSLFIIVPLFAAPAWVVKVITVVFISAVTSTIHLILQSYLSYLSY